MANIKLVTISDSCMLCGLCEQPDVADVFGYDESGKLTVLHNGMVDLEANPKVISIAELCPEKAISFSEPALTVTDKNDALNQLNQIINEELRDYSFDPPEYYKDYAYERGQYQALPVPAKYRSEPKYLTEEMAEGAGLAEFNRAVFSQAKTIAKQYIAAYKIKQLKKYYTYEEKQDNFYFLKNTEISSLLEKAYQLAMIVTDNQLTLSTDFYAFDIRPDWNAVHFAKEELSALEERDIDFSRSSNFHAYPDHYKTWITTGGYLKDCYYDFTKAEAELRDDIDLAVNDVIGPLVSGNVDFITGDYLKKAKEEVIKRITELQNETKKFILPNADNLFYDKIAELCAKISQACIPNIPAPYPDDFDDDYNDDYRFYSQRDCEKAAGNRRRRAYEEGQAFLKNLPDKFNDVCLNIIARELTLWKREVLSIYDSSGRNYPLQPISVHVGKKKIQLQLNDYSDIPTPDDSSIRDYIDKTYGYNLWCGTVNGASYIGEYECEIDTNYDCDFKETLFGGIKEVNKRYGYYVALGKFKSSAFEVSRACEKELKNSEFIQEFFNKINQSFSTEILRISRSC